MKVLLALDGTPHSQVALQLVGSILWPRPTLIQILSVQEPAPAAELPLTVRDELESSLEVEEEAHLRTLASDLAAPGREVRVRAAHGRPASMIIDWATHLQPDLAVVGSRGRGTFATMLLGSVAAEVVDHAPCPVLVARRPRLGRILLADDGSDEAFAAARLLHDWPIFQGLDVSVVSVAPVIGVPVTAGPMVHPGATEAIARGVEEVRERHRRIARDRARELTHAGLHARALERTGDAAEGIFDAAVAVDADLIVMGSRGRGGAERLLLGSAARKVLVNAPCSVLIARRPTARE